MTETPVARFNRNYLVHVSRAALVLAAVSLLSGCGNSGRAAATAATAAAPAAEAGAARPEAGEAQAKPAEGREGSRPAFYPPPPGAIPVVIVPGISGSELALAGGSGSDELLWPPIDAGRDRVGAVRDFPGLLALAGKAVERLGRLSLEDEAGSGRKVLALSVRPGSPAPTGRVGSGDAYAPLFMSLAASRGSANVYFFGYDWRRDNMDSAAALDSFIIGIERDRRVARVDIVAHSMGGLVAMALLDRQGASRRVRRLVLAGSPLGGSGSAFASLAGKSASPVFTAALPGSLGELAAREGTSLHDIGAGLDGTMRLLMRGYPSVYELLTPGDARRLGDLGLPGSEPERRAAASAAVYRDRITRRLPSIRASARAAGVEVSVMAGSGVKTLARAGGAEADSYVDGDGLVTPASAEAGGQLERQATTFSAGHIGLVQDEPCLRFIAARLAR